MGMSLVGEYSLTGIYQTEYHIQSWLSKIHEAMKVLIDTSCILYIYMYYIYICVNEGFAIAMSGIVWLSTGINRFCSPNNYSMFSKGFPRPGMLIPCVRGHPGPSEV